MTFSVSFNSDGSVSMDFEGSSSAPAGSAAAIFDDALTLQTNHLTGRLETTGYSGSRGLSDIASLQVVVGARVIASRMNDLVEELHSDPSNSSLQNEYDDLRQQLEALELAQGMSSPWDGLAGGFYEIIAQSTLDNIFSDPRSYGLTTQESIDFVNQVVLEIATNAAHGGRVTPYTYDEALIALDGGVYRLGDELYLIDADGGGLIPVSEYDGDTGDNIIGDGFAYDYTNGTGTQPYDGNGQLITDPNGDGNYAPPTSPRPIPRGM